MFANPLHFAPSIPSKLILVLPQAISSTAFIQQPQAPSQLSVSIIIVHNVDRQIDHRFLNHVPHGSYFNIQEASPFIHSSYLNDK